MIKKTRDMRDIQEIFKSILEVEFWTCDMFNGMVDSCVMDREELAKMRSHNNHNLHKDEIEILKKEDIMANPYLSNITVPRVSSNNFHLSNRRIIRPGLITKYKCKSRNLETMRQENSYFMCDDRLRFPGLSEGDNFSCWMTVEPFEIESFKPIIEEATGDVLLIGCGLGYAAYMLSEKDDVTSVTIIDSNEDVLELFNTNILPQFKNKDKVHTIKGDGIEYLKTTDLSIYDHVNVDIWYDTVDMIYPYLRCLEIEKANPNVTFSYWLEDELKESIQKCLMASVANDGVPANKRVNYTGEGFLAGIIADDVVAKTPLNTYDDIHHLIDISNLRDFLFGWYANNLETVEKQEPIDMRMVKMSNERTPGMPDNKLFFK